MSGRAQAQGGGGPQPDPRVLGWLLATHNILQVLPTGRKLGEFLARALRDLPGVAAAGLCLVDAGVEPAEGACAALEQGYAQEPPSGCVDGACVRFPLATARGRYGQLVLDVRDPVQFEPYRPFLSNYAGSLAIVLENRKQRQELEDALEQVAESEKRYRQLFTEMTSGHAMHEIVLDDAGIPCDYRFLEINPAFEELTGLRADEVVGKTAREVLPGLEPLWVERYGHVALTGEPVRFEDYNSDLDRHYEVVAYRTEPGQFAVVFNDVTERRRVEAERERLLEQQTTLFHELQEALQDIPRELPGVRFGHLYRSATEQARIGGDFYDVFELEDGRIGLLIGDVCGHGIQAARIATMVKDSVGAFAHQFRRPHLVLRDTNRLLLEKKVTGFVTVFLGVLEPGSDTLIYASAGHPAPFVAHGSEVSALEPTGPPLGVFHAARYHDCETYVAKGSLLLLYTDGITEARRGDDLFGEDRLRQLLSTRPVEAEFLPEWILERVLAFSGDALRDDIALLALSFTADEDAGDIIAEDAGDDLDCVPAPMTSTGDRALPVAEP